MGETEISWTHRPGTVGRSWNPGQGCSLLSEGCRNCYAMRLAARFAENGWSKGLINLKTKKWNGTVRLVPHKLAEPLSWRKPSTVFANSMTDLFHEGYSNEQIAAVFGVMAACPQHTFQVLTKRAKRMREWFEWAQQHHAVVDGWGDRDYRIAIREDLDASAGRVLSDDDCKRFLSARDVEEDRWPLPNVWLGVSVENQEAADERIPELLATPAAVRFLSCEPLLGLVDISPWLEVRPLSRHRASLDWIIAGCESGPGARRCSVEWLRSLRDQCTAAGVAFFLKQAVERWVLVVGPEDNDERPVVVDGAGSSRKPGGVIDLPYLDGVQHAAFPDVETTKEAPMRAAANAAARSTGDG